MEKLGHEDDVTMMWRNAHRQQASFQKITQERQLDFDDGLWSLHNNVSSEFIAMVKGQMPFL